MSTLIERLRNYSFTTGGLTGEAADEIEKLEGALFKCREARLAETIRDLPAIKNALDVARKLECMLLNGAKGKRAYDKMQGQAELIVTLLSPEDPS